MGKAAGHLAGTWYLSREDKAALAQGLGSRRIVLCVLAILIGMATLVWFFKVV